MDVQFYAPPVRPATRASSGSIRFWVWRMTKRSWLWLTDHNFGRCFGFMVFKKCCLHIFSSSTRPPSFCWKYSITCKTKKTIQLIQTKLLNCCVFFWLIEIYLDTMRLKFGFVIIWFLIHAILDRIEDTGIDIVGVSVTLDEFLMTSTLRHAEVVLEHFDGVVIILTVVFLIVVVVVPRFLTVQRCVAQLSQVSPQVQVVSVAHFVANGTQQQNVVRLMCLHYSYKKPNKS